MLGDQRRTAMQDTHSDEPPGGASLIGQTGELRDVQVPELLWRLHEGRRTGCLRVQRGDVVKQLWLMQGQPVFARSNQSSDRLTDRLLARGLLSRAQYDAAQHLIAAKDGKRIGELLGALNERVPGRLHAELRDLSERYAALTVGHRG